MRVLIRLLTAIVPLAFVEEGAFGQDTRRDAPKRMVLVELPTSLDCDMCPAAEAILGTLAERDRAIVPIAFHVDYFKDPRDAKVSLLSPSGRGRPGHVDRFRTRGRGIVRYGWEGELSYKGAAGEETVRRLVDALLRERP
jgi:hypothetical protein